MNIKPEDIHYEYDSRGYMMYYKGFAIGGAGIDKYAQGCRSHVKLFKECAVQTKRNILSGYIDKYMLDKIKEIEEKGEA